MAVEEVHSEVVAVHVLAHLWGHDRQAVVQHPKQHACTCGAEPRHLRACAQ